MVSKSIVIAGLLMLALSGCRSMPAHLANHPLYSNDAPTTQHRVSSNDSELEALDSEVVQTAYHPSEEIISESSSRRQSDVIPVSMNSGQVTLAELEQLALAGNPAIRQIEAEIDALRGKLTQAGLPPNPSVGVLGDDINEDGGSGRYGVFIGREIVRGNKLNLSRSVVCAEIDAATQRLAIIQQRLLTDVRQRYYELLVAQEKIVVAAELVVATQKSVDASQALFEAAEAARTAVLQSQLELENARVTQRRAENELLATRRKLAALLGETELPLDNVDGDIRNIYELDEFELSFDSLVSNSPEIAALFAEVEQARRQLARECVEAVPNVTWQTTVAYDTVGDDVVAGFQIGMPLPTINRNQGAIYQARQQITAAQQKAEKRALDLRQRLADGYEAYLDAKLQVDAYSAEILPKAQESYELISQGYAQGEIDFLQLLTAQRTYSQTKLIYLDSLRQLWKQNVHIRGLLLDGSLE